MFDLVSVSNMQSSFLLYGGEILLLYLVNINNLCTLSTYVRVSFVYRTPIGF